MSSTHVSLWSTPRNLLKKQKSFMETPELMIGKSHPTSNRRVLQKQLSVDQMQNTRSWTGTPMHAPPQQNQLQQQQQRTNHQETSGLKIVANNMSNHINNNNHRNKRHHLLNQPQPTTTTGKNE